MFHFYFCDAFYFAVFVCFDFNFYLHPVILRECIVFRVFWPRSTHRVR